MPHTVARRSRVPIRFLSLALIALAALLVRPTHAEDAPPAKAKVAEAFTIYRQTVERWEAGGKSASLWADVERTSDVFLDAFLAVGLDGWDATTDGAQLVEFGYRLAARRGVGRHEPEAAVAALDLGMRLQQGRDMNYVERRDYVSSVFGLADAADAVARFEALLPRVQPADRASVLRVLALRHAVAGDFDAAKARLGEACEVEAAAGSGPARVLEGYEGLRDGIGRKPKKLIPVSAIREKRNLLSPRKGTALITKELELYPDMAVELGDALREAARWIDDDRARIVLLVKLPRGIDEREVVIDFPGEDPSVAADEKTFDDVLQRWCDAVGCPFPVAVLRDDAEIPNSRYATAVYDDQGRLVMETSPSKSDVAELVYGVRNLLSRQAGGGR